MLPSADEPRRRSRRGPVAAKCAALASILGLTGAGLAICTGPACTFDLVEPRLDAGTSTSSSSGAGGSTVDDHVSCLFGAGDEAKQAATDLAVGAAGDFAMVGSFLGSIVFGDTTLTNPRESGAAFIAQFDSACGVVWAKSFSSGVVVDPPPVVAADGARLIAAGSFQGTADLAGERLSAVDTDGFVIGFDPRGAVARVLHLSGSGKQDVLAAARAGPTGWVVVGSIGGELWWGPPTTDGGAPLLTAADGEIFVMRIEEDAAAFQQAWVRAYSAQGSRLIEGVAVDGSGNVAVVGRFQGTLDFGGACSPLEKADDEDMFVVKLDPDGNCLWAHPYGSTDKDEATAVAFDSQGDLVVSANFTLDVDFGTGVLSAPEGTDPQHNAALVKLDANGTTVWALGFGDDAEQHGWDVAVGADDAIYTAIGFESQVDLDPAHDGGEVESIEDGQDVLVASFDRDGGYRWGRRYGNAGEQSSRCVGVDAEGTVTVAGSFSGALETSAGTITGDSLSDAYALRIAP